MRTPYKYFLSSVFIACIGLLGIGVLAGPADRQPNSELPMRALITASQTITNSSKVIIPENPKRVGLVLYNNSANSVYIAFSETANSATNMTLIIGAFAHWYMPVPVYRGVISGIRNSGTGIVLATELQP